MVRNSCCQLCLKKVPKRAYALQCDKCDQWVHTKCANIPSALYVMLRELNSNHLKFDCLNCNHAQKSCDADSDGDSDVTCIYVPPTPVSTPKVDNLPRVEPKLDVSPKVAAPRTYADVTASSTHDIPTAMSRNRTLTAKTSGADKPLTKASRKTGRNDPVKELLNRVTQLENLVKKEDTHVHSDRRSRLPNRERCLIVMNAPEPQSGSSAERIIEDQAFLQGMVSKLFDEGDAGINVISAFRLGRRSDDAASHPRPLKVVLSSEDECRRVFTRTFRLKGEGYRILRDLNPEDRIRMRQAVEELRERRKNGETNLHIVDFQVVQKRPRVVWHPLLLLPRAAPQELKF